MKRVQLVEAGIIVVVLVLFYQFIISLCMTFVNITAMARFAGEEKSALRMMVFFPSLLLLCGTYLLLRFKSPLARLINGNKNDEVVIPFQFSARSLLHIAIITVSVVFLFHEVADLVDLLIRVLRTNTVNDEFEREAAEEIRTMLYISLAKLVLAGAMLLFSRRLSLLAPSKTNEITE